MTGSKESKACSVESFKSKYHGLPKWSGALKMRCMKAGWESSACGTWRRGNLIAAYRASKSNCKTSGAKHLSMMPDDVAKDMSKLQLEKLRLNVRERKFGWAILHRLCYQKGGTWCPGTFSDHGSLFWRGLKGPPALLQQSSSLGALLKIGKRDLWK